MLIIERDICWVYTTAEQWMLNRTRPIPTESVRHVSDRITPPEA